MHILNLVLLYSLPNTFNTHSALLQALSLTVVLFSSPAQIHMFLINYVNKQIQKDRPGSQVNPSGSFKYFKYFFHFRGSDILHKNLDLRLHI